MLSSLRYVPHDIIYRPRDLQHYNYKHVYPMFTHCLCVVYALILYDVELCLPNFMFVTYVFSSTLSLSKYVLTTEDEVSSLSFSIIKVCPDQDSNSGRSTMRDRSALMLIDSNCRKESSSTVYSLKTELFQYHN